MIKFGGNLKRLRIKNELTQEQLAEAFGISPQAVSRWENSTTYPDITWLPTIANFFDTTTDELLGVDIERRQQEIDAIIQHNNELHYQGKIEESIVYLREKIRMYPKSQNLAYQLAHSLYINICNTKLKSEESISEVISLCKKAIALDKGESSVTVASKHHLCLAYRMLGKKEDAVNIAESMPSIWVSREIMLVKALDGEVEVNQRQHNLLTLLDLSMINLHHLSRKMKTPEESIVLLKKAIDLAQILTGDDHKFYNERVFKCYLWIAKANCSLENTSDALENLELALEHAIMYEERPDHSCYNAFWLKGYEDNKTLVTKHSDETLYQYLLTKIQDEPFSLLHGTNEFARFAEKVYSQINRA